MTLRKMWETYKSDSEDSIDLLFLLRWKALWIETLPFIIQEPYREMEPMPADSIELIQFVYLLEEIKTGRSEAKQKLKVEDVPWDWRG